jgi:hypothetical protein
MFNTEVVQEPHNFRFIINTFGYLDHLGKILDQTAIRSFRGLARSDPTPLGRVQVTSFKVRL